MDKVLTLIEEKRWTEARSLYANIRELSHESIWPFIELIYLLQDALIGDEVELTESDVTVVHSLLQEIFESSYSKFKREPEYLFFVGYMMSLCDWCFRQEGTSLSHKFLKEATELSPDNLVFKWAYSFSTSAADARDLSDMLSQDNGALSSLKTKGKAGNFMADTIANASSFLKLA